jgi:hypothetical protein
LDEQQTGLQLAQMYVLLTFLFEVILAVCQHINQRPQNRCVKWPSIKWDLWPLTPQQNDLELVQWIMHRKRKGYAELLTEFKRAQKIQIDA